MTSFFNSFLFTFIDYHVFPMSYFNFKKFHILFIVYADAFIEHFFTLRTSVSFYFLILLHRYDLDRFLALRPDLHYTKTSQMLSI